MIKSPVSLIKQVGLCAGLLLLGCEADLQVTSDPVTPQNCDVSLVVLGIGQDAGAPQIGNPNDPAWSDPSQKLWATSLGLVDHRNGKRYLFEATPDIREQINWLDGFVAPKTGPLGVSGVFLTHAHIGHYAGLMFFGRESAGAQGVKVYAMPKMAAFLESNGPWGQLVELGNIELQAMQSGEAEALAADLTVTPYQVPHRDEYSETVGYAIKGPDHSVLFVPDIDDWDRWQSEYGVAFRDMIDRVDYAYLDATFFDNNELPGRDMSQIPHPRVPDTMNRLSDLSSEKRAKIRFIHFNHTNPLRDKNSDAFRSVQDNGFGISQRGDEICL